MANLTAAKIKFEPVEKCLSAKSPLYMYIYIFKSRNAEQYAFTYTLLIKYQHFNRKLYIYILYIYKNNCNHKKYLPPTWNQRKEISNLHLEIKVMDILIRQNQQTGTSTHETCSLGNNRLQPFIS